MASEETTHDWIELVRAEYLEMPGLALSKGQARRLWSLDEHTCDLMLEEMVRTNFLKRTPRNLYVRVDPGR